MPRRTRQRCSEERGQLRDGGLKRVKTAVERPQCVPAERRGCGFPSGESGMNGDPSARSSDPRPARAHATCGLPESCGALPCIRWPIVPPAPAVNSAPPNAGTLQLTGGEGGANEE